MSALRSLWDDDTTPRPAARHVAPARPVVAPLLPLPDVPRIEQRPHRHLFLSQLGDDAYDAAVDAADRAGVDRDRTLHGNPIPLAAIGGLS